MSKLSNDDMRKLARLSKLAMTDDELDTIKAQLNDIFEFVHQLQDINTDGVEPTEQVSGLANAYRPDTIKDYGVSREDMLKNVPKTESGYVKVPKVL